MKKWNPRRRETISLILAVLLAGNGLGMPVWEVFAAESEQACTHTCENCDGEYTQSATSGALSWACGHVHDETCSENTAVAYELAENAPNTLYVGGVGVIIEGSLTETTSGEGWSYDSTSNTLTLDNANITGGYVFDIDEDKTGILFSGGELNIDLNGENQITYGILGGRDKAAVTIEGEHAGADSLTLSSEGIITDFSITIYNATITSNDGGLNAGCSGISGNLTIENSFVTVKDAKWQAIYAKSAMTLKNSYVEVTGLFCPGRDNAISDSHLVLSGEVDDNNVNSISWTDCVVAGKHINSAKVETGANCVTVYGNAALKKPLTVTGGQIINYVDSGNGASLAYEEGDFTVENGATVQINGEVHTHNTNGAVSYEALDATHHTKKVVCKDCIAGYIGSSTEEHVSEIEDNKATCTTQAVCDLCGESYGELAEHSFDETNSCICGVQAVVKVGDTGYGTLEKALTNWTDGTTLTLLDDVTYNMPVSIVEKSVILDLNGHTLDMSDATKATDNQPWAIWVGREEQTGELTIKDSGTEGKLVSNRSTLFVNGTFTLENGDLAGYIFAYEGSTVNIKGGSVTAVDVLLDNNSHLLEPAIRCQSMETTINISGGKLYGQYGVFMSNSGELTISGTPVIEADKRVNASMTSAISVSQNITTTISGEPTFIGGFNGDIILASSIVFHTQPADGEVWSVYMYDKGIAATEGIFAIPGEGVTLDAGKFTSAREGYVIVKNEDGTLKLAECNHSGNTNVITNQGRGTHGYTCSECNKVVSMPCSGGTQTCKGYQCETCEGWYGASLAHSYNYLADENTDIITETCDRGCGHSETITLKAPENAVYDGSRKEAAVEGSIITEYGVSYNAEPVNAGNYTATLTVGEASVSVDFAITQANSTYTIPTGLTATYGQTLGEVILNTTTGDTPGTWSWEDEAATPVGDAGSRTFTATFTPADTTNYNIVSGIVLTIDVLPLDITSRADISVADFAPLIYNGQTQTPEAAVTLPGTADGEAIVVTGEWSEVINVSDATIFVTTGNFTGTLPARATGMTPKEVASPVISGLQEYYQLDGVVEPQFTLLDGNTVIPSDEYTVTYSNNTAVGTGLITVADRDGGNYTVGSSSQEFLIIDTYDITLEGEGLIVGASSAKAGELVTVTWNVDAAYLNDYQLELSVQGASDTEVPVTSVTGADIPDNVLKYTFVMPAEDVTVTAVAIMLVYSDTVNRPMMDTAAVPIIDFIKEKIEVSAENMEYSDDITGGGWEEFTGTLTAEPGACLWFRTKGSLVGGVYTPASAYVEMMIPSRANLPFFVETVTETTIVINAVDEKYAETTMYGVLLDGAAEEDIIWQTGNKFTGLKPDTYYRLYLKIEAKAGKYFAVGPINIMERTKQAVLTVSEVTATGTYGEKLSQIEILGTVTFNGTEVPGVFMWETESADETILPAGSFAEYRANFVPDELSYGTIYEIPVTLVINKAKNAPNMPAATRNVAYETELVESVTLPEGWVWKAEDASLTLTAGMAVKAIAVYDGADKGNYENETVEVTITRSTCSHRYVSEVTKQPTVNAEGERTYTCGICGHSYTETIAKLEPTPAPRPTVAPVIPMPTSIPTPVPTQTPVTPTPVPSYNPEKTWVTEEEAKKYKEEEKQYEVLLGTSVKNASLADTVEVGGTIDINFYGVKNWRKADYTYKWTSSDESVATVDKNGMVTMLDEGIAVIRLELVYIPTGELLKVAPILIGTPEASYDVFLGTSAKDAKILQELTPGGKADFNFYGVKNWKKENYVYEWSSSNEEVAEVNNTGVVTAKTSGITIIRLKLKNTATGEYLAVAPVVLTVKEEKEKKN